MSAPRLGCHPEPLEHGFGRGIGLLPLDTPIAQLLQRNSLAGDGTAHEAARPQNLEVAVQILDDGFPAATVEAIQHRHMRPPRAAPSCLRPVILHAAARVQRRAHASNNLPCFVGPSAFRLGDLAAPSAVARTAPSENSITRSSPGETRPARGIGFPSPPRTTATPRARTDL